MNACFALRARATARKDRRDKSDNGMNNHLDFAALMRNYKR